MERLVPPDFSQSNYAMQPSPVKDIGHYTNCVARWFFRLTGFAVDLQYRGQEYCINRGSLARFISQKFAHQAGIDDGSFKAQVLKEINKALKDTSGKTSRELASFIELILGRANVPVDPTKIQALTGDFLQLMKETEGAALDLKEFVQGAVSGLKAATNPDQLQHYQAELSRLKQAVGKLKKVHEQKEVLKEADRLIVRSESLGIDDEALVKAKNDLESHKSATPQELTSLTQALQESEKSILEQAREKEALAVALERERAEMERQDHLSRANDRVQYGHTLLETAKSFNVSMPAFSHLEGFLKQGLPSELLQLQQWQEKAKGYLQKAEEALHTVQNLASESEKEEQGPVFIREFMKQRAENSASRAAEKIESVFQTVAKSTNPKRQKKLLDGHLKEIDQALKDFSKAVKEQPLICDTVVKYLLETLSHTVETKAKNVSQAGMRKVKPLLARMGATFLEQFKEKEGLLFQEAFLSQLTKIEKESTGALGEIASLLHQQIQISQCSFDFSKGTFSEQLAVWFDLCLAHPTLTQEQFARLIERVEEPQIEKIAETIRIKCQLAKDAGLNFEDDLRLFLFLVKRGLFSQEPAFKNKCALFEKEFTPTVEKSAALDLNASKIVFLFNAAPEASQLHRRENKLEAESASELALEFGLQKLSENAAVEAVHPIFMGTEWAFMTQEPEGMVKTLDRLSAISRAHPQVTFMPGSIAWFQKMADGSYACYNTLPVFENGRLVALYHKRHEKMDLDTVAKVFGLERSKLFWAMGEPTLKTLLQEFNSNLFVTGRGLTCAFEICNDHINLAANEDYTRRAEAGTGTDLHLLMAHGSILNTQRTAVREGALIGYIDHSSSAQTSVSSTKKDLTSKDKQSQVNANYELLGAYKTHLYQPAQSLQAAVKEQIVTASLFEQLSLQLHMPAQEIQQKLIDHLVYNRALYSPEAPLAIPKAWSWDRIVSFQQALQQRYTFSSQQDLSETVEKLKAGQMDEWRLLPLLSTALGRQIVLKTNSHALTKMIFDPEGKKPTVARSDALTINLKIPC